MAECSSSTKWACSFCTYLNYETSLKCTVCLAARDKMPLIIEDVAGLFSDTNVSHLKGNERWSCPSCTYLNFLLTKKCIQCYTERPIAYNNDPALNSTIRPCTLPKQVSTIISRALNKWTCVSCTFDNWPIAARCTMCGANKVEEKTSSPTICSNKCAGNKHCDDKVENLTRNFAASTFQNITQKFNQPEHYTSALDIYLRRFAANDHLECLFFKAASNIAHASLEVVNSVVEYLINEGNVQRRFSSFEVRLLNLRGFFRVSFEASDSLVDIAKKCDCADLVKLMRRITSVEEKLPCVLNCSTRNRVYAKVAQLIVVCNGNFSAQFIAHPYNFNILQLPMLMSDYNLKIMNAMLKPAPSIPPIYCFVNCFDTIVDGAQQTIVGRPPNFLMKNRGGVHSLCDSIFQSMFGICDRYNILRSALKYTMIHSDHLFKQRWHDQCMRMARDCGITLSSEDLENDWEEALNALSNEDDCLEPIHIWALSHVVCRPIVVVSMNNIIELDDLEILDDNFVSRQKARQHRNHVYEGIYLPILWPSTPVSRSPLIIAFRNGLFYAVIVSDGLYRRNQKVQRFLKISYSKRNDNFFRFLTLSELENSNLLAQFISLGVCSSSFISIRRDPHRFLFETLLFYNNWICAVHCCDVESSNELKMSQLEQKIDSSFELSQLRYGSAEKFSIFTAKASNVLKRNQLNISGIGETSINEPITLDSEEDEEEEEDDDDDDDDDDEGEDDEGENADEKERYSTSLSNVPS